MQITRPVMLLIESLSCRATSARCSPQALRTMFDQIIANNRAGGWRRLKRGS
jgi:hypothetical protein